MLSQADKDFLKQYRNYVHENAYNLEKLTDKEKLKQEILLSKVEDDKHLGFNLLKNTTYRLTIPDEFVQKKIKETTFESSDKNLKYFYNPRFESIFLTLDNKKIIQISNKLISYDGKEIKKIPFTCLIFDSRMRMRNKYFLAIMEYFDITFGEEPQYLDEDSMKLVGNYEFYMKYKGVSTGRLEFRDDECYKTFDRILV